jgi:hypothetical protein
MQNLLKVTFKFRWYKLLLLMAEMGLLAFGIWACLDTITVGASHAAFRFLLLFVVWSLPGIAVLVFVRPKTEKEAQLHTSALKVKTEVSA